MATTNPGVKVIYKFIDGVHFFVSDEKEALGLCVAHADLEPAYYEVGNQLAVLYEHNHGKKVTFAPAMPFDEFKKFIDAFHLLAKGVGYPGQLIPSSIQPWMYQENKRIV